MSSAQRFPLEFAEIEGVGKEDFWTVISGLAEIQKEHPELYGQVEIELEWVDVTLFKYPANWPGEEERWLHGVIRELESNGVPAKTYVIPFRGSIVDEVVYCDGIPGDVLFFRVHGAEPYPMMPLRDEHVLAQSYYSEKLAELPSVRKEKLRLKLEQRIASTYDPHWTRVYNFLYPELQKDKIEIHS
ncbi:hypothetical protein SUGI_0992900 [Cryptomeria japonica]|nr:hypothetical protein SUGI_0992900 [Cryptomeria japonica]